MSIIQISVVRMAKSLMPQPFFSSGIDGRDRNRYRDLFKGLGDSKRWSSNQMEGCRPSRVKLLQKRCVAIGREVRVRPQGTPESLGERVRWFGCRCNGAGLEVSNSLVEYVRL